MLFEGMKDFIEFILWLFIAEKTSTMLHSGFVGSKVRQTILKMSGGPSVMISCRVFWAQRTFLVCAFWVASGCKYEISVSGMSIST